MLSAFLTDLEKLDEAKREIALARKSGSALN
jgi:hypothetical protein